MDKQNAHILIKKKAIKKCVVSVIIPVYNVERYLRECLDSISQQSLREIEIICVNDGSQDSSLEILLEYADKDDRFTVITQNNSGTSAARNQGTYQAEGEYLYFMDSDDMLQLDGLQTMYNFAVKNDLKAVYFDGVSFAEKDSSLREAEKVINLYSREHNYPEVLSGPQLLYQMQQNNEYRVSCPHHMVQREYFKKNGLWFEEGIIHEDNLYTFRCMLNADRVGYIHKAFYNRRIRSGSVMTEKKTFNHSYGYFVTHIKMIDCLKSANLSKEEQEAASEIIYNALRSCRYCFSQSDEIEREKAELLPSCEKWLFKAWVSDYVKLKEEMNEKCRIEYEAKEKARHQLNQAYADKAEINERLQSAFQDRTELKQKLQNVLQEKNEIELQNRKMIKKVEQMNVKLQKNSEKLKESNKKVKKQAERIEKLEQSLVFRIERKLRAIKKKILDFFKGGY